MPPQIITLARGAAFSVAILADGGAVVTISPAPEEAAKPSAVVAAKPDPLFAPKSPWNSRPIKPVLGTDTVPATKQTPWIEERDYASKVYRAAASDGPVTITVGDIANQLGGGAVTIAHFPAGVIPATGSDGHCEVIEPDGTLHSFFQLRSRGAAGWIASKYARTSAVGSGWGSVANPDNVRAAGSSTAGGLLLASERGMDVVPHALAIGMDKNGIKAGSIFPATLEDYQGGYTGKFPMGSLMMLPASFNPDVLGTPELRTIARTLMTHGGYLVDATVGSMNIYAEIGSGWANGSEDDLKILKAALRQVVSQSGWLDGDGKPFTPTPFASMNLVSMRGPWDGYAGSKPFGRYEAAADLFQAEATTEARTVRQLFYPAGADRFGWKGKQTWNINPEPGVKYRVTAFGSGTITATIAKGKVNSGKLAPGQSATIVWPDNSGYAEVFVDKPAGAAASIRMELVKA